MQTRLRRPALALLTTGLLAVAVTACGGTNTSDEGSTTPSDDTSSAAGGGELNIALQGDITTYDPWSAQSGYNGSLLSNQALYDSLVHLDASGEPQPWLVTDWTEADSSHYTLTLRDDVTFTDGTPLDADAVVANFEYAKTATTPGECNEWVAGVTATATDATTVDIALDKPSVGFMTDLGTCAGLIVNPTAFDNPESLSSTPAGSGPYLLDDTNSVQGQVWAYTRNPDYWAPEAFPFDTIKLTYFSEATAASNAAKAGQIDLIQSVDATDTSSGLAIKLTSTDFRGLMFNDITGTLSEPLADVRVRQAMQYAIDREAIASAIYGDAAETGYSTPFTTEADGWTDALKDTYPYDPEKAKELLAEAGYADGFTVKVMTVPFIYGDAAQAIAGQLAEVGITLELSDQSADFFQQLTSKTWPMITYNFSIGTNPIHTYENLVSPNGFWNVMQNESPTIEDLLGQLDQAGDDAARTAILEEIAKEFQTESWYLSPTLVRGACAYDDQKLVVDSPPGSPVPFLYMITPA
ncbi:ABC transporter substrate-binding protein [Actinotalea sp. M2MS4P-6]|uniref:ABC transporter substrate-binding protein n=1 Tax=Actinotalea sp. M2MS4P-6 TaxID=2983762 RepID=UPI0021E4BE04|nr:ABC transporter substrate-binding protein [Actinotalea sp. M2MS4P-6]MCV2394390.1 ABC transporter substrate-binding protein [Actinotalea sp. M2MS4P-6]